ncbi:hypothetical protein ScPMuIL_005587 [Solemya velum]
MEARKILPSLLVAVSVFRVTQTTLDLFNNTVLSVEPTTEPYVFIGSILTLTCTIISDEWTDVSTLRFTHNNNQNFKPEYLESSGPNSLQLNYPILREDDGKSIFCWANRSTGEEKFVFVKVKTEYRTRDVENFSCRLYNYDESLFCHWEHGVEYVNASNIAVTTLFRVSRGSPVACDNQIVTSCRWNSSHAHQVDRKVVFFMIFVNNIKNGDKHAQSVMLDMKKSVQPKPLSVLEVITINSTCVFVHWSHDRIFRSKDYRIQYWCLCSWDATIQSVVVSDPTNSTFFCDLNPATQYQITVAVKPVEGGFWSEERTGQNETFEDVPGTEPGNTAGAIISSSCQDSGYRTVQIFWSSIPLSLRHGHEGYIEYRIHYSDSDKNHSLVTKKVWEELDLKCDENYDIRVHAATRVGPSTTYALFQVNPVKSMPKPPEEVRVEFVHNSTELSVEWTVLPSVERENVSFTVFWCPREYGEYGDAHKMCQSEITWKVVTEMNTTIPVARGVAAEYWYGVSMETSRGTSGFYWQQCLYDPLKSPEEPPEGFQVSDFRREETISVQWYPPECNSIKRSAFITSYRLTYCVLDDNSNCTDSSTSILLEKHRRDFVITDLDTDHKYGITLTALSEAGPSPQTKMLIAKPPTKDIRELLGLIIALSLVFSIIVVVSCIFVWRRCQLMWRKSEKVTQIRAPDISGRENLYISLSNEDSPHSTNTETIPETLSNGIPPPAVGRLVSIDSGTSSPGLDSPVESSPFSTNAGQTYQYDNDVSTEANSHRTVGEEITTPPLDDYVRTEISNSATSPVIMLELNSISKPTGIEEQTNLGCVGENIPAVLEPMSSEQVKGLSADCVSNTSPYVGFSVFNNAADGKPDIAGGQSSSTTNISPRVSDSAFNNAAEGKPDIAGGQSSSTTNISPRVSDSACNNAIGGSPDICEEQFSGHDSGRNSLGAASGLSITKAVPDYVEASALAEAGLCNGQKMESNLDENKMNSELPRVHSSASIPNMTEKESDDCGQQPTGSDSLGAASGLNRTNAVSDYVETSTLNTNMTKRETYPGIGPETKSNQVEQSVQLPGDESSASTPTNTSDVSSYVEASHLNMNSSKRTEKDSETENNRLEGKVIDGVEENYVPSRDFSKNLYALTTVPKQSLTISPVQETPSAESNTLQRMQNSQGYISPESMTPSATSVEETTPRETVDVESNNSEGTTPSSQLIMNGPTNCDPEIDEDKIAESRRPRSGYIPMNQVDGSGPSRVTSRNGTEDVCQPISDYTFVSQLHADIQVGVTACTKCYRSALRHERNVTGRRYAMYEMLQVGVTPCTKCYRLALSHVRNVTGWRYAMYEMLQVGVMPCTKCYRSALRHVRNVTGRRYAMYEMLQVGVTP